MEENAQLSIAMTVVMHYWRGKVGSTIFDLSLSDLLSSTKFCGARDPKDKVSALLALASDVDLDTFHIDYRMS